MPNAWGSSWGGDTGAWGLSWGSSEAAPPAAVEAPRPGGAGRVLPRRPISRVQRELLDKERISREAAQAISEVARRQAERLELDELKRFEELERELSLRSVEWEARYLDLLNEQRESLVNEEIGRLLRRKIAEEEELLLILLAASL